MIGLDVGATKTHGVALAADGRVLAQLRQPTGVGVDGLVRTVCEVVVGLRAAARAEPEVERGPVGVGVPGLVGLTDGTLRHAVNLGVDGVPYPLGERLAAGLGQPVVLENDVKAAALGLSVTSGHRDVALLSIGTGLAAGLVLDGRLRRGLLGAAGEIGHLPVDPAGPPCSCGQRGCLETVASGSALAARWPTSGGFAAQSLFAAAGAGDPAATALRDQFADGIAAAVRLLALCVDVDDIALGGGVSHVGDPLLAAVHAALRRAAADSPFVASLDLAHRVRLVPVDLPVAAIGAALIAQDPAWVH